MEFKDLQAIIQQISESNIDELELSYQGAKLKLKKNKPSAVTVTAPVSEVASAPAENITSTPVSPKVEAAQVAEPPVSPEPEMNLHLVTSPMVGTFYSSSSPDGPAFVSVGDTVSKGQTVCIVEAMKLFNEIDTDVEGQILEMLVQNGQLVEYGQPLFSIRTK